MGVWFLELYLLAPLDHPPPLLPTGRSIVFLNSWICRSGSDSMSVFSGDSILGQNVDICNVMLKNSILWIHPNFVGTVFVAKFGYPGTTPNLLQFVLFWKLSEAFRTGVIKVFEKPFTVNN